MKLSRWTRRPYVMATAFAVAQGVGCASLMALFGYPYWWLGGVLGTIGTLPVHLAIVRGARWR